MTQNTDSAASTGAASDRAITGDPALLQLVAEHDQAILATIRSNGRPQLSTVNYAFFPETAELGISITADRAKYANLLRDPRASLHVASADGWHWTVVDGEASLSPVAADPADETVDELVALFRHVRGEHPDWDEFRAAMVNDRRVALRVAVTHVYGQV